MKTALIIGRKNGAGLAQDALLIADALQAAGWNVRHHAPRDWCAWFRRDAADIVIHLERVFPLWRRKARRHVLIPNQERFPERQLRRLRQVGQVWCKSRHAEGIFARHHADVRFIGFTSPDRLLPQITPDYGRFFHLAGKSTLKGTDVLLALWARHPEWPALTLVQHPSNAPTSVPANVNRVSRYLPDAELRELQNQHGVHLCPSLSEGWGHYIVEAMSCRALVVTTDGPPMNELIGPERGRLVPIARTEARHLGTNYYVDATKLEATLVALMARSPEQKTAIGTVARRWFDDNQQAFARRLPEALAAALS